MDISSIKFNHFIKSEGLSEAKLNIMFFDFDENCDHCISLTVDSEDSQRLIASIILDGEYVYMTAFKNENPENISKKLEDKAYELMDKYNIERS